MFRPQYRYTHTLVENLLLVENARAAADAIPLPEPEARELRSQAHKAHLSAARNLEGSLPSGFASALVQASGSSPAPLDEAAIQKLATALGGAGITAYRRTTRLLYDAARTELIYVPPEADEVPVLMSALLAWLADAWEDLPAVVLAGITHQELLLVQPFEAHNGPLARLAGHSVLARRGYGLRGLSAPDTSMADDPDQYERACRSSHSGVYSSQADFTTWLEYFSARVAAAAGQARDDVLARAKRAESEPAADLPAVLRDRQLNALHYMRENGAIRSGQYQRLAGIVPDTARRDFDELMEKGLIEVRGVGRGTHYVLTRRGAEESQRRRTA